MNSSAVGESENLIIDPENEIKKLQDLVKKLEIQNQLLIKVHNSPPQPSVNGGTDTGLTNTRSDQPTQVLRQINGIKAAQDTSITICDKQNVEKSERSRPDSSRLSLDCFGLVEVDRISLDADDSWLYKSPKHTPGCETAKSPFLWVREEFDQSAGDVSSFRKSLFYKLDEVTRNTDFRNVFQGQKTDPKAGGSSPTVKRLFANKDDGSELTGVAPLAKTDKPRCSAANQAIELLSGNDDADDDDVLTPELDSFVRPGLLTGKDRRVSESAATADAGYRAVSSASEENLLGVKYKHAHVTDIKELAKMQEESLRMSYSIPLGSSKKLLSKSLNHSSGALVNSSDSLLEDKILVRDSKGLNQSTGALLETTHFTVSKGQGNRSDKQNLTYENRDVSKSATSLAFPTSRNAATRSGLPRAAASTSLPGTPYGSNQELSRQTLSTVSDVVPHRQSMPSLNKSLKLSVLKSHPSDSRLTSAGKKPLSLRQPSSSLSSQASPVRGARIVTPVKPKSSATMTPGTRTAITSTTGRNVAVTSPASKSRPTTLSNSEAKPGRAITMSGRTATGTTTPGAMTPTARSKALAFSSRKTSLPNTPPRMSGIPKPGSLTKLSVPCKTNMQTAHINAAANDDDDWKEGCF